MSYHYPRHVGTVGAAGSDRERIADLVHRYPRVTDREAKEILKFMRTGRHLDVGLLTADDSIRSNLDAFMKDHSADFRVKWGEGATVVACIVGLIAMFWLIWEAFA